MESRQQFSRGSKGEQNFRRTILDRPSDSGYFLRIHHIQRIHEFFLLGDFTPGKANYRWYLSVRTIALATIVSLRWRRSFCDPYM